jgi:hypothetical protein
MGWCHVPKRRVLLPSERLLIRGWERKDSENLQRGYQGCPHFAACEGEEGSEGERYLAASASDLLPAIL